LTSGFDKLGQSQRITVAVLDPNGCNTASKDKVKPYDVVDTDFLPSKLR
jgi:hypothetical protein